jgi:hypothetical protein
MPPEAHGEDDTFGRAAAQYSLGLAVLLAPAIVRGLLKCASARSETNSTRVCLDPPLWAKDSQKYSDVE